MRTMIHPEFASDDLASNALELCDLFLLRREEDVPVTGITIMSDGMRHTFEVAPGKYKSALFLLYLLSRNGQQPFSMSDEFRPLMGQYFGRRIIADAALPDTRHTLVRALLGEMVFIHLDLAPGYRDHLAPSRSPEEIVDQAWERRNTITAESPEPFLREAIRSFFESYEAGTLTLSPAPDGPWPTQAWADRALELKQRLGI